MSPDDFDARLREALGQEPLLVEVSPAESRAQLKALHEQLTEDHSSDVASRAVRQSHPVAPMRTHGAWPADPSRRWRRAAYAMVGVAAALVVVGKYTLGRLGTMRHSVSVDTYTTHPGQRADVTLADGSRVTLAPATTLRIERGGNGNETRAILDGEAFFTITHRSNTPFVVVTKDITTHVLGTAFDVRHYRADRQVRVAVDNGKVSVGVARPGAPSVTVTAGVVASVTDSTAVTTTSGDVSNYTSWARGTLAFRHMPASEVLETLGLWYGYQFKLRDSTLASHLLTVRFDGESEASVLRTLGVILDVTMTFDGRVVTLTPRTATSELTRPRRERILPHDLSQLEVGR